MLVWLQSMFSVELWLPSRTSTLMVESLFVGMLCVTDPRSVNLGTRKNSKLGSVCHENSVA